MKTTCIASITSTWKLDKWEITAILDSKIILVYEDYLLQIQNEVINILLTNDCQNITQELWNDMHKDSIPFQNIVVNETAFERYQ